MDKEKFRFFNLLLKDIENSYALKEIVNIINSNNTSRKTIESQDFDTLNVTSEFYVMPEWNMDTFSNISFLSGCSISISNGSKKKKQHARIKITGRKNDLLFAKKLLGAFFDLYEKKNLDDDSRKKLVVALTNKIASLTESFYSSFKNVDISKLRYDYRAKEALNYSNKGSLVYG